MDKSWLLFYFIVWETITGRHLCYLAVLVLFFLHAYSVATEYDTSWRFDAHVIFQPITELVLFPIYICQSTVFRNQFIHCISTKPWSNYNFRFENFHVEKKWSKFWCLDTYSVQKRQNMTHLDTLRNKLFFYYYRFGFVLIL